MSEALKAFLLKKLGLPDYAIDLYRELSAVELVRYFYRTVADNYKLTETQVAEAINPAWNGAYLHSRIHGKANLSLEFIEQFAAVLKPYLEKGAKEGWLEVDSFKTHPFESLLAEAFPQHATVWEGKTGLEAVRACIESSGLPGIAVSTLLGHHYSWVNMGLKPDGASSFCSKDIIDIIPVIAPYLNKQKTWQDAADITDPEQLRRHAILKQYLVQRIEAVAGKKCHLLRQAARRHATVGPLVEDIRTSFISPKILKTHFGEEARPQEIYQIESNCFNVNSVKSLDDIGAPQKALDAIAQKLGEAYKDNHPIKMPEAEEPAARKRQKISTGPDL